MGRPQFGDRTYKVPLDGYDQMDLITGKGPSKRNEIFYFSVASSPTNSTAGFSSLLPMRKAYSPATWNDSNSS